MEIFKDYYYIYAYDTRTNTINTELRISMENRVKIMKVKKLPCINRDKFIRKAQEKGIILPNDFRISWSELYRNCENLVDINVFHKFKDFNKVDRYNFMFENCIKLENINPFYRIKELYITQPEKCIGMFNCINASRSNGWAKVLSCL